MKFPQGQISCWDFELKINKRGNKIVNWWIIFKFLINGLRTEETGEEKGSNVIGSDTLPASLHYYPPPPPLGKKRCRLPPPPTDRHTHIYLLTRDKCQNTHTYTYTHTRARAYRAYANIHNALHYNAITLQNENFQCQLVCCWKSSMVDLEIYPPF